MLKTLENYATKLKELAGVVTKFERK